MVAPSEVPLMPEGSINAGEQWCAWQPHPIALESLDDDHLEESRRCPGIRADANLASAGDVPNKTPTST